MSDADALELMALSPSWELKRRGNEFVFSTGPFSGNGENLGEAVLNVLGIMMDEVHRGWR